ncbi:unnamed protein product [Candidula unifasciata]|uniref:ubiquitinyl hydrolase 1 n=1 Tax=Candidula unifasciata TaxID=100452 RepID=A0A8S3Z8Z6_9EUPU|nr:unnamed protein product [Candidula unifasciata]
MTQLLSTALLKKKETVLKWIRDRVDYSREAEQKPYTFHRYISFLDCQLPCMSTLQPQLRTLYISNVVDEDMKMDLENCHSVNWLSQAIRLTPVNVPRDGNCLLHAASVAVWGVEDNRNTLRDLMLMTIKISPNFKKRWWSQLIKDLQSLKIDESEIIEQEWDDVIRSISDLDSTTKSLAVPHRFLEGIHIYIVANILRRPIIVVTNSIVTSVAGHDLQENHIGGVYLPLEWAPIECCKTPIILGYSLNHFCPLLSETQSEFGGSQQEKKDVHMFPLVASDLSFLLVRYLKNEEELQAWDLINSYLLVEEIETPETGTRIPFVRMQLRPLEQGQNSFFELLRLFKDRLKEAEFEKNAQGHMYTTLSPTQQRNHPFYDIEMNSQTEVVSIKNPTGHLGESKDTSHLHNQAEQKMNNTAQMCIREGCRKQGCEKLNNMCFHCYRTQASMSQDKNVSKPAFKNTVFTTEGYVEAPTEAPGLAITPTAPPLSLEPPSNDPLLSMMTVRCINGCGYRCSNQTYPYCHECSLIQKKESEQNVNASTLDQNSVIIHLGPATGVHDPENSGMNFMEAVLSSSPASSTPISSWMLESGNNSHLLSFPSNESCQPPKSGSKTLMDKNCKHFDLCSGVKMLDHDICFSCAQKEESPTNTSKNAETETQLSGDRNMIIAEASTKGSLKDLATSFAEMVAGCMSGDIEVSEEPTCKVECPFCGNLIFPQEKLCKKCKDILQKGYEQTSEYREINPVTLNTASKLQSQKMGTGSLQDKKHSGKLSSNQESEGKIEGHKKGLEISHSTSKLAQFVSTESKPHPTQGKRCIKAGCSNYGDPVMDNKCSSCYYEFNPLAKPQSSLVAEKKTKAASLYPKQDANEKLSKKQLYSHSINSQPTEQLSYTQKINRPTPADLQMHSSGAKTAPVKVIPCAFHGNESHSEHPHSLRDVMVTSKSGYSSYSSFHPGDESSLQPLPEHTSYSFNHNSDKSFERTFQTIEVEAKKSVRKCVSPHCHNYGNKHNKGYCNSCFRVIRKQMILEQEAVYAMDVPDKVVLDDIYRMDDTRKYP